MRTVRWTPGARSSYRRFLRELKGYSAAAAVRAEAAVERVLAMLAQRPRGGRPSRRWEGYREWPFTPQHKLVVYEFSEAELIVAAFYDMRQDLDRVQP